MLKETVPPSTTVTVFSRLFSGWTEKRVNLSSRLLHPNAVLAGTALIAYWGVWQLGYAMDDWSNLADLRNVFHSIIDLLRSPHYNRFPVWGTLIGIYILQMPLWLSHTLVIVIHTVNSMLFRRGLERTGFGRLPALVAAMLFLVWPCHSETLLWLAAGAAVLAAFFVLIGLNLVLEGRYQLGTLLVFTGFLNSEGLILPGAFALLLVLWYKRVGWVRGGLYLAELVGLLVLEQLIRLVISTTEATTPYPIGLTNFWYNVSHLSFMQIGQASSQDVNWIWRNLLISQFTYTGLIADYNIVLLAALFSAFLGWWAFRTEKLPGELQPFGWKFPIIWLILLGLGWLSAMAIFTILTVQLMQTRYTYTMTFFFCASLVLLIYQLSCLVGRFLARPDQGSLIGQTILRCSLIGLLTWSIFLSWSDIYRNWLPSKQISEKMINDFKLTGAETKVKEIYIVDGVQAVGNAYAIAAPWGYHGVAELFLGKDVVLAQAGDIAGKYPQGVSTSQKFTNQSCVFIGWQKGNRVLSYKLASPNQKVLFNCRTGTVEPLTAQNSTTTLTLRWLTSSESIKDIGINP